MVRIAPSILSADFAKLGEEVREVEAGGCDLVHIDVMDGRFVPNITIGPLVVTALRPLTSLELDVHLMIENSDKYIADFAKAGADIISVHIEACPHLHRTIALIKSFGAKAGVALNPATPLTGLEFILPEIDQVILMSVNPGFGGQKFIPQMLKKIVQLKKMLGKSSLEIMIDGGINIDTIGAVVKNGATAVVAGNAVFGSKNRKQAIGDLKVASINFN